MAETRVNKAAVNKVGFGFMGLFKDVDIKVKRKPFIAHWESAAAVFFFKCEEQGYSFPWGGGSFSSGLPLFLLIWSNHDICLP